jgi:hypothetical protein
MGACGRCRERGRGVSQISENRFGDFEECSFCRSLREAESVRTKESVADLERHLVRDWIQQHGSLCKPHAKKALQILPVKLHRTIVEMGNGSRKTLLLDSKTL